MPSLKVELVRNGHCIKFNGHVPEEKLKAFWPIFLEEADIREAVSGRSIGSPVSEARRRTTR